MSKDTNEVIKSTKKRFLSAAFWVFIGAIYIALIALIFDILGIKNIFLQSAIFFAGIYFMWQKGKIYSGYIQEFLTIPMTEDEKKQDRYPFLRTAFIVGFSVIATTTIILLYVRLQIETIREITGFKYLAWGPAMATTITIGIFAIFAFIVTIWRGNLHSSQVDSQIKQLEQGNQQLRETENNNIAKLLVDGTKLLGDETSEAEKIAGIACLANIIEGNSSFAEQAVNVLKSFIASHPAATDPMLPNYKIFDISKGQSANIVAALLAIDRYGERRQETVSLYNIALKAANPSVEFKWIKDLIWFKSHFFGANISGSFSYVDCFFTACTIRGDTVLVKNNKFVGVSFNSYNYGTLLSSQLRELGPNFGSNDSNVFKTGNTYNPITITSTSVREYLESKKVKLQNPSDEAPDAERFVVR